MPRITRKSVLYANKIPFKICGVWHWAEFLSARIGDQLVLQILRSEHVNYDHGS